MTIILQGYGNGLLTTQGYGQSTRRRAYLVISDSARWQCIGSDESENGMTTDPEEPNVHDLGDLVRVTGIFTDPEDDNEGIEPDVVKLSIKKPSGTVSTYTFGTGDEITQDDDSDNIFHSLIDVDEAGTWYYRWWSTGDGQAADENQFEVAPAFAV